MLPGLLLMVVLGANSELFPWSSLAVISGCIPAFIGNLVSYATRSNPTRYAALRKCWAGLAVAGIAIFGLYVATYFVLRTMNKIDFPVHTYERHGIPSGPPYRKVIPEIDAPQIFQILYPMAALEAHVLHYEDRIETRKAEQAAGAYFEPAAGPKSAQP